MPAREALEGTIADATAVAECTGLPPQTAKWTAFASLQSGVFTRAQVRAWLGAGSEKTRRTVAARIVKALLENELAAEYEVAGIGKCVQIQAKRIYRALGEPENRNRRKPGRQLAIERLLTLDYVLDIRARHGCRPRRPRRPHALRAGSRRRRGRDGSTPGRMAPARRATSWRNTPWRSTPRGSARRWFA